MEEALDPNSDIHFLAPLWVTGCYGADYTAFHSEVAGSFTHLNGSGVVGAFYGNTEYEQAAVYANVEYVLNVLDLIQVLSYSPRDGNGVTQPVNGTITDERRIGITFNYQL